VQLAPSSLCIEIRISVTGSPSGSLSRFIDSDSGQSGGDDDKEEEKSPASVLGLSCVKATEGRPDLKAMLQEEVGTATGRMSVNVCGSQSIASAVRCAPRFSTAGPTSVLKGGLSVTLHVEPSVYA